MPAITSASRISPHSDSVGMLVTVPGTAVAASANVSTAFSGAKLALPALLAVTVQVPADTIVTVAPETVQTAGVLDV